MPINIDIFRPPDVSRELLLQAMGSLQNSTTYSIMSLLEEAPEKTDCLSSICDLFKRKLNIDFPLTFIGDIPRELYSRGWQILHIEREEARCGDILFVKNRLEPNLITAKI